ncbi:hypothetical protein BDZ89DRAFT_1164839, partial [Hymenopellis radicata]
MTLTISSFNNNHSELSQHSRYFRSTMSISTQTSEVQRIARTVPEAVQPLVQSNDIPTQLQLNTIHAWKKSLDAALASLPDADTQTTQRRSVAVAAHRRLYRSFCSAIRRLPVEVLQAIFLELGSDLDADSNTRGYDVFNVNAGPWPLICVSRLWRAAALGCPELWATISVESHAEDVTRTRHKRPRNHIALLKVLFNSGQRDIGLLRAALVNSGQRDLYIRFMDRSSNARTLLHVLVEHCNRWREVYLYMSTMDASELSSDLGRRMERLKALTYWTHGPTFTGHPRRQL